MKDVDNWPRVIQLAWMVCDETGAVYRQQNYLIKPDGWIVPTEKFWIDNGFSQRRNLTEGTPLKYVLDVFLEDYDSCDISAAHNLDFDRNIVGAELIRYNKVATGRPTGICTKKLGTNVCKIPGASGGYKWPTLEELHKHFFGSAVKDAHDALADVKSGMNCLIEMIKRKVIVIES
ncbi:MAG: 3'-5' exonuclease [Agriterribacter sp.]